MTEAQIKHAAERISQMRIRQNSGKMDPVNLPYEKRLHIDKMLETMDVKREDREVWE